VWRSLWQEQAVTVLQDQAVGDGAIVVFLERKRIGHFLFTAVFATSVLLLLILLKMLDYPFEGALTLSSADFVKTIERVSTTMGGV
jgi:hypothetical protein